MNGKKVSKGIIPVITAIFVASLLFASPAAGQIEDPEKNAVANKEYFFIDPLVFYSLDSTGGRLDLYIELMIENLILKKNYSTGNYEANIDYTVLVKNSVDNEVAVNQSYSEVISNTAAELKNIAGKSVFNLKQFNFLPGTYNLTFILRDKNNNNEYRREAIFYVKDTRYDNIFFSDVMLLSDYKTDETGKKEITPLVNNNVGNLKEFYLFFEVANKSDSAVQKTFSYKVTDEKGRQILQSNINLTLSPGINSVVEKVKSDDFYIGNFKLEIFDSEKLYTGKYFTYRWSDLPININDIDRAISQLIYIANSDELENIKDGKTPEERLKRFIKFWTERDPSPKTTKNEVMVEYYNRIKIANERYSHYVEGWKTDMGMVFIIFGNPSNIERHPFESDSKPYEIWDYYDINRRFIFVDETGFGDYRLITPIWDERFKISRF